MKIFNYVEIFDSDFLLIHWFKNIKYTWQMWYFNFYWICYIVCETNWSMYSMIIFINVTSINCNISWKWRTLIKITISSWIIDKITIRDVYNYFFNAYYMDIFYFFREIITNDWKNKKWRFFKILFFLFK